MKECATCRQPFIPKRSDAIYCSARCGWKARNKRPTKQAYVRAYYHRKRKASVELKAYRRAYYAAHSEKIKLRSADWGRAHPSHRRMICLDWRVRGLPENIKDMRRTLYAFKVWCKGNGYSRYEHFSSATL